ncbi:unnamed protein product [Caenorhabditis angaria]|uniref:7TM GPCR serpentine receptor class x (Srx) domain-containing protein n=1 Tax=Caenorhabditis angaria TaxID=860376 RepID=A0A9P1I955_9PELO|nr:unnamed protein product [Caenorhabditis angaria]
MSLSNKTLESIWIEESRPEDIAERWMTISAGLFMIFSGALGIFLNSVVFYRFITQKNISGFYILCASKTISNNLILLGYVFYNGPVALFNTYFGPDIINIIVNQSMAYGVYVQGPLTQLCIAANRFLVIILPAHAQRDGGKCVVFTALSFCWCISLFVLLAGFPDNCLNLFNIEILTWDNLDPCVDILADSVMYLVMFLAVCSNSFNVIVATKLIFNATNNHIDSYATKRRKQTARKLFMQNCFQDWVYLIDTLNSMYVYTWSSDILYQFFFTMFSNLFVHVADAGIMLLFNYEKKNQTAHKHKSPARCDDCRRLKSIVIIKVSQFPSIELEEFIFNQNVLIDIPLSILRCGQPFNSQISIQELDSNKLDQIVASTSQFTTVSQRNLQLTATIFGDELHSDKYNFQLTVKDNCLTKAIVRRIVIFHNGIPIQKSFYNIKIDLDLDNLSNVIAPIVKYYQK